MQGCFVFAALEECLHSGNALAELEFVDTIARRAVIAVHDERTAKLIERMLSREFGGVDPEICFQAKRADDLDAGDLELLIDLPDPANLSAGSHPAWLRPIVIRAHELRDKAINAVESALRPVAPPSVAPPQPSRGWVICSDPEMHFGDTLRAIESKGAVVFGEDEVSFLHNLLDLYQHTRGGEALALSIVPTASLTTTQVVLAKRDLYRAEVLAMNLDGGEYTTKDPTFLDIACCNRILGDLAGELSALGPTDARNPATVVAGELESDPLCAAIDDLGHCLKRHRLLFLYSAECARRNPLAVHSRTGIRERVCKEDVRGWNQMLEHLDSEGHFLFEYSWAIENFAQEAIAAFGPGKGAPPTTASDDGSIVEVEGGGLPYWVIDEFSTHELERSSQLIFDACRAVTAADSRSRFAALVEMAIARARPEGHPRWYSSVVVCWECLELLDTLLAAAQRACVEVRRPPQPNASAGECATSPQPNPEMAEAEQKLASLYLLMLLAQAYYKILECTVSMADWCTALDLELNQSYLWVTKNLTNLLKNDSGLEKDFPEPFEPLFPDLYPSTIRDHEWEDMVGPEADRFLSTVQRYTLEHGIRDPDKGSAAWAFVEWFRPSIENAIKQAEAYNARMKRHMRAALGPAQNSEVAPAVEQPTKSSPVESVPPDGLASLLEDANDCLIALEALHRDFETKAGISDRMQGDGEDWCFADHRDESEYRSVRQRIESSRRDLDGRLSRVLTWGRNRGMDVFKDLEFLDETKVSAGVKAALCCGCVRDVRSIVSAMLIEVAKSQLAPAPRQSRDGGIDGKRSAEVSVEVGDPGEPCFVLGREKKPLTDGQRAVVTALMEARDEGLTKDPLERVRSSRPLRNSSF